MRIIYITKRIIREIFNDKKTLLLMLVAPLFVLTLMNFIFNSDVSKSLKVGYSNLDSEIVTSLKDNGIDMEHYINNDNTTEKIEDHNLDGFIYKSGNDIEIIYKNLNPSNTTELKLKVGQALNEYKTEKLSENTEMLLNKNKEMLKNQITMQEKALQDQLKMAVNKGPQIQEEIKKQGNKQINDLKTKLRELENSNLENNNMTLKESYLNGTEDTSMFNYMTPALIGFFVFFFVFLISGTSLLKERTTGTLNKILATPVKRYEIVFGYLFGYGIFGIIQTVLVVLFAIYALKITVYGSLGMVIFVNILAAFSALSIGIFLSTVVTSEFQLMQFIPIIILPQVFLSGIIPMETMNVWIQNLAKIFPMYYIGDALIKVMLEGKGIGAIYGDLIVIVLFIIVFTIGNIIGLKRYRKV